MLITNSSSLHPVGLDQKYPIKLITSLHSLFEHSSTLNPVQQFKLYY